MMKLVERLRADAEHHKEIAHDCDCRPEITANWRHSLNCLEAADRIEQLTNNIEGERMSECKRKLCKIAGRCAYPEDCEKQPSSGNGELLQQIGDNKEVIISIAPQIQMDADEPRSELCIAGPTRLVDALFEVLSG